MSSDGVLDVGVATLGLAGGLVSLTAGDDSGVLASGDVGLVGALDGVGVADPLGVLEGVDTAALDGVGVADALGVADGDGVTAAELADVEAGADGVVAATEVVDAEVVDAATDGVEAGAGGVDMATDGVEAGSDGVVTATDGVEAGAGGAVTGADSTTDGVTTLGGVYAGVSTTAELCGTSAVLGTVSTTVGTVVSVTGSATAGIIPPVNAVNQTATPDASTAAMPLHRRI
ncbi:MAG TPA: hypothetical protein VLU24_12460 [Mycobacterium sp.]|nr:hypothetical protein [Mycobacterium sp.]